MPRWRCAAAGLPPAGWRVVPVAWSLGVQPLPLRWRQVAALRPHSDRSAAHVQSLVVMQSHTVCEGPTRCGEVWDAPFTGNHTAASNPHSFAHSPVTRWSRMRPKPFADCPDTSPLPVYHTWWGLLPSIAHNATNQPQRAAARIVKPPLPRRAAAATHPAAPCSRASPSPSPGAAWCGTPHASSRGRAPNFKLSRPACRRRTHAHPRAPQFAPWPQRSTAAAR
jgi:hypothetical protein